MPRMSTALLALPLKNWFDRASVIRRL